VADLAWCWQSSANQNNNKNNSSQGPHEGCGIYVGSGLRRSDTALPRGVTCTLKKAAL
jgi:hypothetical protein